MTLSVFAADTAEQIHLGRHAHINGIGTPERTRNHAGIEQFCPVEKANKFLPSARPDRSPTALVYLPHNLEHSLAVDFSGRMSQRQVTAGGYDFQ